MRPPTLQFSTPNLRRHRSWRSLMLWPEEMPDATVVALSGNDDLVPSVQIERAMRVAGKGRVLTHPQGVHGSVVIDRQWQALVVAEVARLVREGEQQQAVAAAAATAPGSGFGSASGCFGGGNNGGIGNGGGRASPVEVRRSPRLRKRQ